MVVTDFHHKEPTFLRWSPSPPWRGALEPLGQVVRPKGTEDLCLVAYWLPEVTGFRVCPGLEETRKASTISI